MTQTYKSTKETEGHRDTEDSEGQRRVILGYNEKQCYCSDVTTMQNCLR